MIISTLKKIIEINSFDHCSSVHLFLDLIDYLFYQKSNWISNIKSIMLAQQIRIKPFTY